MKPPFSAICQHMRCSKRVGAEQTRAGSTVGKSRKGGIDLKAAAGLNHANMSDKRISYQLRADLPFLMSPDIIQYDVTIEDPKVFTRPWRIAMPIYRRVEPNMQLLEFRRIRREISCMATFESGRWSRTGKAIR